MEHSQECLAVDSISFTAWESESNDYYIDISVYRDD